MHSTHRAPFPFLRHPISLASPLRLPLAAWAAALALAGCAAAPSPSHRPSAGTAPQAAAARVAPPAATGPDTPASSPGGPAADMVDHAAGFAAWRAAFSAQALEAGIQPGTVRSVLGQAQWQPRVVELDRAQPEFTRTPWSYLDNAVSPQRIAQGQAKLAEHSAALEAAAARYGVPATLITAIWGMESNYGSNFGTFRTVDALSTLAYEGRRRTWAQAELLAALRIVDQGDIPAERMLGSWAGAMGHTQFLPSVFLAYAVDADGDGHRDIWGSIPDVVASTAHFLSRSGWQSGEPWGAEVQLPAAFDHARADPAVRQTSAQWEAEGVRTPGGQPLPPLGAASIATPAGARGPAFLVGANFRAILRYNNSVNYALAVALLSRQIGGGGPIAAPWPRDLEPLSRTQLQALQEALNRKGFAAGTPDGVMGPATRAGLRAFQRSTGSVADGYPTLEMLQRLQAP
ncbi:lytic murein transglycosylase [Acidovorax sp. sif1233]|uniref:lytic murein transglycosylase n=1 Tax=unclassified Acidovorax TaxID=2684926 RepID=UPI001C43FFE4|nr:lytic murein transglycosylase [Acidovorax sp. sif0732]MBV7451560.1 lytic murein transglycosylase [Acidovorax sp. sif0715]MBV7454641.1 lytic murein transglycosylase [Acidovorax sp. sif1233]